LASLLETYPPRGLARDPGRLLTSFLLSTLLFLTGCGRSAPKAPVPQRPGAVRPATAAELAGRTIYEHENCARCHTMFDRPAPDGAIVVAAPPEEGWTSRVGPDLGLLGHRRSDDWHLAHLYAPAAVVRGSPMPASRHLFRPGSDGRPGPTPEALALVVYLQSLGREESDARAALRRREPDIPPPPPAGADLLVRGDRIYVRQCASCHGAAGDGRGEAAALLLFPPRDFTAARYRFRSTGAGTPASDADLYRIITLGTGIGAAMPAFDWLRPDDRWAVVLRIKQFSERLRGLELHAPQGGGTGTSGDRAAPGEHDAMILRGRDLWGQLGCESCHGRNGEGMDRTAAGAAWCDFEGRPIPRASTLTHACSLRGGASPEAIDRALYGGGLAMPSYADAIPGSEDRRALRTYILSLQDGPQGP